MKKGFEPRECLRIDISGQLVELLDEWGTTPNSFDKIDAISETTAAIMAQFERFAVGKVGNHMTYCDPHASVEDIDRDRLI